MFSESVKAKKPKFLQWRKLKKKQTKQIANNNTSKS